ncbi:MAG: hypothetical protein ABSA78_13335 [Candidatus Sulfotelmatobacter sp.]|jgi:hypothetical protein
MSKQRVLYSVVILGLILSAGARTGRAQETAPSKGSAATEPASDAKQKSPEPKPLESYHLDFAINEFEDGKKINSRLYALNLNTNDSNDIKIGTRIPVEAKEGEFQYIDVGTNINAQLREQRGQTMLVVRAEVSNFAIPEQGLDKPDPHPALRQLKVSGSALLPLAKPMVMDSVDDPNSKRQFQLEVTVTKLR